ncbi:hypothetical protein AGDE_06174 [Angomonas deanei]|nr:hypothetical protein AGDE_06174 [Angomonas deanei]|eukprot:EPY37760.1 hypothetical protein AGDE_06174 [Angomonas deanei]
MLGVDVPGPIQPPDDAFAASKKLKSTCGGGTITHDYSAEERERTAKFLQDNGKLLRFYGLLEDRREGETESAVRKLEVLLYVEDSTIAVVERQNSAEANPAMFFSRNWLPKSGSVAKANELTFSHRVNGQRAPDMGPEGHYTETDLSVGEIINVMGRPVFLYDCDDFTRNFYRERYGYEQPEAEDVSQFFKPSAKEQSLAEAKMASRRAIAQSHPPKKNFLESTNEVLRFRLKLANPTDNNQAMRRFVLSYYTDTEEGMVHEVALPNLGFPAGLLLKRGVLPKPEQKMTVRQATLSSAHDNQQIIQEVNRYKEEDIAIGSELVLAGMPMKVVGMDAHTEARMLGRPAALPSDATVDRLLTALLDFTWSRYGTAVKTFLAMDADRDGVVGIDEFTRAVKQFQITDDPIVAHILFERIASIPDTAFLTTEDVMKWMGGEKSGGTRRTKAETVLGKTGDDQKEQIRIRALRQKTLLRLKERLEARKMHSADMFRMASTMPRAYREKSADVYSLTNPMKDAGITPVQLRRCIEEILGGITGDEEMFCIIEFFFPNLPKEEYLHRKDLELDAYVTLPDFQKYFTEMTRFTMLPE